MMPGFFPVYKRELRAFFQSSSAYVALGLLFLIAGAVYHDLLVLFVNDSGAAAVNPAEEVPNITVSVVQQLFQFLCGIIMFSVPILSMRLIASERSSGTFELLVSCPISDWSILIGKYLALVTVGALIVALSSLYPLTTWYLGRGAGISPEWPVVIACAAGLLMIFCAYAAFGLMASALTDNQVTAAILTLVGLLFWNMLAEIPTGVPEIQHVLDELSASRHTENFTSGLITFRDFTFYSLASFFCLFIAARTLEARKWKV